MRFSTLIIAAVSMTSSIVFADTHYSCVCVNQISGSNVYNAGATQKSCASYKARNTGNNYWDQCADCDVTTGANPHCLSESGCLGGKEFQSYCNDNGAVSICD